MEGLTKGRWLFFVLACYMDIVLTVFAYKKPVFCQKEGEPFSFLWSIKRDPPSYLFGTIHVPYTRVWDHIPENAKLAFSSSSSVFFELDLLRPDTVSALATCQMLPGGASLRQVLPEDIYARLKRHLEYVRGMMPRWTTDNNKKQQRKSGGGMYYADSLFRALAGDWERKRPVWVMLMVNGLTEGEVRWRGVPVLDLFLAQEAERTGKGTAAVETVEEQCLPLNGLNISQVLFALNHTLLQHELREHDPQSSSYTADDLIHHYNCGDLDSSVFGQDSALPVLNASSSSSSSQESSEEERNIDAYFRQELIYNRNRRMGSRVVELMEKNQGKSLFFAFGAGHFLGNNSVLDFIQDHGFEVEHLSVNAKIPKSKSKKSVNSEKSVLKPDSETVLNRKGQGRRSSRHRNPSAIPSLALRQRLFDTSTPVTTTTQRAKSFNDLWVRLDVNEKKRNNGDINSIGEHRGPHQAFQKWYQESHRPNTIPISAGATLLNSTPALFIIAFICSYFSMFHIDTYVITLIGVT